jgi:type IV pilus biogenesis protein CpaD/CtpE
MTLNYKTPCKVILTSALCALLVVACAPKKKEEEKQMPPQEQGEKKPDTFLSYPQNLGEKPSQEDQKLQQEEDEVMNPLPG